MKTLQILVALIFTISLVTSCGISKERSKASNWEYAAQADEGGFENTRTNQLGKFEEEIPREQEKKVIFNANLSLAVENPDSTNVQLEAIAKKYKGYVTELGSGRSIIRVNHLGMKAALLEVESLGKVQSKNVTGKDVTNDYLDFKIRLENAEKARNRYLDLLEKAENVEAALLVEKELERLNGTIDMLKGRMNRIDHLAEFSTITVYIKERKKPGILGYIGLGLYHSVKWLFVRN